MVKILFFPHLRMQSGHHQAAEALMDVFKKHDDHVEIKKIDLLTETSKLLEKTITKGYMQWIRRAPASYHLVYEHLFHDAVSNEYDYKWYQPIFMRKMLKILNAERPDLIFCTHSFPSNILSKLKIKGKCHVPVINVYTDFFVNCVWGRDGIDGHMLPTKQAKVEMERAGQVPGQMFVSGIPVHPEITRTYKPRKMAYLQRNRKPNILVAGGNSGLGRIHNLFDQLKTATDFHFQVLCGKNERLYKEIKSWALPHIEALPYLSSRSEMNQLYDQADALITKPGGVTVSEALRKHLPIFIHAALPGQEEINMEFLLPHGLVVELEKNRPLAEQLVEVMMDEPRMKKWQQSIQMYEQTFDIRTDEQLIRAMNTILHPEVEEKKFQLRYLQPVQE